MQQSIKVLVAVLLLAASPLAESAEKYSGDWLANELGLNNPNAAGEAINKLKNSRAPSENEFRAKIDTNLVSESVTLNQLVGAQRNEDALVLAQKLIDQVMSKLQKTRDSGELQLHSQFLFNIYMAKIRALYQNRQAFEALFHGLKMRSLCNKYAANGCSADQLQSLETMLTHVEQAIKTVRPADALGIAPGELGDQTKLRVKRRRLMSLLHPDKNMDMDEKTRKELGSIFDLANKTYDGLLGQLQN